MTTCTICGVGDGERIGTCHTCERDLDTLRLAWSRIRLQSTVIPSASDERILDGLAEMLERLQEREKS